MDRLLRADEVAEMLRMSVRGLWKWNKEGKRPHGAVIGGKLLYKASEVDSYIREAFDKASA